MKYLIAPLVLVLLQSCSKDAVPADEFNGIRYYDGGIRIVEFYNVLNSSGGIDTTYRLDTSYAASLAVVPGDGAAISFRMPGLTMFPNRGGSSVSPILPARIDSPQFVFTPVGYADGVAATGGSGARQLTFRTYASGDSLSFIDFDGDFGQRYYRIEHRFSGRLRR